HAGDAPRLVGERERPEAARRYQTGAAEGAGLAEADVPTVPGGRGGDGVLAHLVARLDVPDAQGRVAEDGAADGPLAVGRERHGPHLALVACEAADLLPGLQVPQSHGRVLAARQQQLAVARHVQPVDRALVALEAVQLPAGLQVPDADRPLSATRDGLPAARQEGE